MNHRVWIVEDESEWATLLKKAFQHESEFECFHSVNGDIDADDIHEIDPDIVILDQCLAGGQAGLHVLRFIRNDPKLRWIPVLMLTVVDDVGFRVRALEEGADDYLVKQNFHADELVARVRALLRRDERFYASHRFYEIEDLKLDMDKKELTLANKSISLTPKQFDLMCAFLKRPNVVIEQRVLFERIWGYETLSTAHNLEVTISALRAKLAPKWSKRLVSVKGQGYMLETPLLFRP